MLWLRVVVVAALVMVGSVDSRGGGVRPPEDPNTESGRECRDGVDNDNDGTLDCADPDCASTRMCAGSDGGGRQRPGMPPEDPSTETGRECVDGVDNDGDGMVDCADPDCAAIVQLCGDPTCFTAGSEYTSTRCCDTSKSPTGDTSCWGGGYDFPRCCPRTHDCSIQGFAQISTRSCPAPTAGKLIPDTCPVICATAMGTWATACADQAVATLAEANSALGGGVSAFMDLCRATANAGTSGH